MPLYKDAELAAKVGNLISDVGKSRNVFEYLGNEELVIKKWKDYSKIEMGCSANNWLEWQIWHCLKNSKYEEKFARCDSISQSGLYLAMEKLAPLTLSDQKLVAAEDWPVFLTDKLAHNFGKDKSGNVKCLDYSSVKADSLLNLSPYSNSLQYDPFQIDI